MALLPVGVGTLASPAHAQTVDLAPVADATMYEPFEDCSNPSVELNANGGGDGLFIGRTGPRAGSRRRRAVVRFDVAAAIPAGATVESATLSLTVDRTPNSSGFTTELRSLQASWNEGPSVAPALGGEGVEAVAGDVTWCDRELGTAEWGAGGGDIGAAIVGSLVVGDLGTYVFPSSPDMVAAVQAWLDDPGTNYGWLVRGGEGFSNDNFSARRLASREADQDGPVLTVTYSGPQTSPLEVPLSGTAMSLLVAVLAWCGVRWLRAS